MKDEQFWLLMGTMDLAMATLRAGKWDDVIWGVLAGMCFLLTVAGRIVEFLEKRAAEKISDF